VGSPEALCREAGLYSYDAFEYLPFAFRESNLIVVGGEGGSGLMKEDSLGRTVDSAYCGEDEALLLRRNLVSHC